MMFHVLPHIISLQDIMINALPRDTSGRFCNPLIIASLNDVQALLNTNAITKHHERGCYENLALQVTYLFGVV